MISDIIIFLVACLILIYSGGWTTKSLTRLSISARLSYFVLSFILVAVATSIPEFLVGISSAAQKVPIVSLGNVFGSNIVNLTLILGIAILLVKKIDVKSTLIRNDFLHMALIGILPIALLLDSKLSRLDGLILILAFCFYLFFIIKERTAFPKHLKDETFLKGCGLNILIFIVSIAALIVSANYVVKYGVIIAHDLQIPVILISLFLIALGTSLPELVFTFFAAEEKKEMVLGNLIGSTVANSSLILGITAILAPITLTNISIMAISMGFVTLIYLILLFSINFVKGFNKTVAIILFLVYFSFIALEIFNVGL